MTDLIDMVGHRVGDLSVLSYAGGKQWHCMCQCGLTKVVAGADLRRRRYACTHRDVAQRFEDMIDKSGDCWLWLGYCNRDGYGVFRAHGRTVLAHRMSMLLSAVPMPNGTEVDHLCRVRRCVNIAHLECVPHAINVRRGSLGAVTAARYAAARKHKQKED